MEHPILKLTLGALVLAALGFAGYRFMQNRDNVEIQSQSTCGGSHYGACTQGQQCVNMGFNSFFCKQD